MSARPGHLNIPERAFLLRPCSPVCRSASTPFLKLTDAHIVAILKKADGRRPTSFVTSVLMLELVESLRKIKTGEEALTEEQKPILEKDKRAARRIEHKYGRKNLGWDDFDWACLADDCQHFPGLWVPNGKSHSTPRLFFDPQRYFAYSKRRNQIKPAASVIPRYR